MSVYCIGDIHGNSEALKNLLKKISFNTIVDKLYILGDVVDGDNDGIDIIEWIINNKESVFLIKGNHESFLETAIIPTVIMIKENHLENLFQNLLDTYSYKLWTSFFNEFLKDRYGLITSCNQLFELDYDNYINLPKLSAWIRSTKKRRSIASTYYYFINNIKSDLQMNLFNSLLAGIFPYRAIKTINKILQMDLSSIHLIKTFLSVLQTKYNFNYNSRNILLYHEYITSNHLKHTLGIKKTTILFGHTPVALMHRSINKEYFDFDYKKIFSYIDINNNCYYNLDLSASKNIIAFRLDDFKEFYSCDTIESIYNYCSLDFNFQTIGHARFPNNITVLKDNSNDVFLTYKNKCYEFVIAYLPSEFTIYYYRVDYINFFRYLNNYKIKIKSTYTSRDSIYSIVTNHYSENGFDDNGAIWNSFKLPNKLR